MKYIRLDVASRKFERALTDAARGGHFDVVYYLIRKRVCVDNADYKGTTAIIEAVKYGHLSVVELLVANKADVSQTDGDGGTLLISASRQGRLDIVKYLLKLKVVVDEADCTDETAFMKASANGHLSVAQYLAEQGANVHRINIGGQCAFEMAVENGHSPMVDWLVEQQTTKRKAAILKAAKRGHLQVTLDLLDTLNYSKRNIALMWPLFNEASKSGNIEFLVGLENFLEAAAENGKFETIKWLVKFCQRHKRDPGAWHQPALEAAAGGCHLDVVKDFVSEYKPTLDVKYAALCTAADLGHFAIAQFLIEEGALQEEKGFPRALTKAVCHGYLSLVEYLAEFAKERLDEKDDLGRTSIMYAVCNGHLAVVDHLARVGADVTLRTVGGELALTIAAGGGHLPVVKRLLFVFIYFIAYGVDLTVDGMLLMKAASAGHMDTVKFFVESGMDVNYIDDNGDTALTLAAVGGWIDIVEYLVNHGAKIKQVGTEAIMIAAKNGRLDIMEYLYDTLSTTSAAEPI